MWILRLYINHAWKSEFIISCRGGLADSAKSKNISRIWKTWSFVENRQYLPIALINGRLRQIMRLRPDWLRSVRMIRNILEQMCAEGVDLVPGRKFVFRKNSQMFFFCTRLKRIKTTNCLKYDTQLPAQRLSFLSLV